VRLRFLGPTSASAEARHSPRLKAQFDDDAIIEFTALIGFHNLSSKFNAALGVVPEGFCRNPRPARSNADVPNR
jgi:alkylhydroperoxidase family enzyme